MKRYGIVFYLLIPLLFISGMTFNILRAQCSSEVITIASTSTSGGNFSGYQTYTAPQSGVLSGFRFYVSSGVFGSSVNVTYKVYDQSNTLVHQQTVGYSIFTVTYQWLSVNFNNANLYVTSGSTFKISWEKAASGAFSVGINNLSAYSGGSYNDTGDDLASVVSMSAPASVSLSIPSLSFGQFTVGSRKQDSVTVSNPGCYILSVTSASATNGQISVSPSTATIAAGESQKFYIAYVPSGATSLTDSVTFVTNGLPTGTVKLPLSGSGQFQSQSTAKQHLTFDGTDDYVVLSSYANLKLTTGTVEAWIKTSASNSAIFSKANEYSLMINGGNLGIYNWGPISANQGYQLSTTNVADGAWHHVAMSFQSGVTNGTILYVDGAQVYTTTLTRYANEVDNIFAAVIGNVYSNTLNLQFPGSIDEVRLWNTVRTKEQIRENMHLSLAGNESGLYGYWRLDETSGTSVGDGTGHGYSGTYQSLPTQTVSEIPLGTGSSKHYSGVTTGNWDFPTFETRWLRISMYDDPFDNAMDLVVTQLNGSPNQLATGSSTLLDRYWIVRAFGTPGTFSARVMPIVSATFTDTGMADPSTYTLYRRSANSTGAWSSAGTPASAFWGGGEGLDFYGVSSFGQFTVGTNDPLPVELVSFTVLAKKNNVELKWKTATEINNYGFDIEKKRMKNELGSMKWEKVGFVKGNGTTNAPREYSFTDKILLPETYSFRLKQIDRDGKFSYSQEVEVNAGEVPKAFALEQNYPNPFNPSTTIGFTLQESGLTLLKIYDTIGREVATIVNEHLDAGVFYQKTFDASKLSSGIYISRLTSSGKSQMKKMILMK